MRFPLTAAGLAALVLVGGLTMAPSATSSAPPPAEVLSLVRVDAPTRADRQRLADLGLDLSEHAGPGFVDVVLHGAADADHLRANGFRWTVRIPDLVAREAEVAAIDAAYAADPDTPAMPSGRKAYRTLADYEWDLKELARRNPGLVKLIRLPHRTPEGRAVWGVEITEDVTAKDGKPVFALLGLHHAREWPAGEHTIEYGFDLVARHRAGDARIVDLLRRARVVLVPVVNPDGYAASVAGAAVVDGNEVQEIDGSRGGDSLLYTAAQAAVFPAYKRKSCRTVDGADTPPGACTAPGARHLGVDLNRNYGALWGGAGASSLPNDDVYRGPGPFSEPETQNIRELISSRQVTMLVTNHTFAGLVLRAPGVKDQGVTADEPAMRAIGERMAAANDSVSQPGYQLYDTTGTTEDWSYAATGGFGYTFEIPVLEFHPPFAETVETYLDGNREAFTIALEAAADPRHHSIIAADPPPGALLQLSKTFETSTSPVRAGETQFTDSPETAGAVRTFRDTLRSRMVATGPVEWHVNPSTRPAVMERRVFEVSATPTRRVEHDGKPASQGDGVDIPFTLGPDDAARLDATLTSASATNDLDLEVYRVEDGDLTLLDSSATPATSEESVSIDEPGPGDYVLRVVTFQSDGTPFHLEGAAFGPRVTKVHPALVPFETWKLSCMRPDGTVLQTANVQVGRGDRVVVDLAACRAAW